MEQSFNLPAVVGTAKNFESSQMRGADACAHSSWQGAEKVSDLLLYQPQITEMRMRDRENNQSQIFSRSLQNPGFDRIINFAIETRVDGILSTMDDFFHRRIASLAVQASRQNDC